MSTNTEQLQCYNRGCGQKFDPAQNLEDSCRHHPGQPVFHDAYKGWSCCNKKCTDFTEFLNIKGCTLSKHSNEKPPEPEKPAAKDVLDVEVVEVKPIVPSTLIRPSFDSPLITLKPELAPSLKNQTVNAPKASDNNVNEANKNVIEVGTSCKNGGCNVTYQGPETNSTICLHHPGVPIFHEGLKFWSCCQKRTSDFTSFLNQIGCERGNHVWIKENEGAQEINCRWDYHQTGSHVVVAIYAKNYSTTESLIKLNPIRLSANLVFPQEGNGSFNLDIELRGIIDVDASQVTMYGTKVEIKMKKAEPGSWARLDIPKKKAVVEEKKKVEDISPLVDAVDLSDL